MLSTMQKFIPIENIPKKYGGQLDWSFGDMPFLEPDIANNLRWKEDIRQKGHRTLPIGPIRWRYDDDGDLVATAIGSENGKPRNTVIAGLHPEAGVARLALSPGRSDPRHNTLHKAASKPDTAARAEQQEAAVNGTAMAPAVAANAPNGDADLNIGRSTSSAVQDTSRAGTYTIPLEGQAHGSIGPDDARQGTSSTRFEQQHQTHAQGLMAQGTPETKIDSQGEKLGIMEPNTIGQAPKEHPMPNPDEGQQASVIEQAQQYAGQAIEQAKALPQTVMSAVGLGGKSEEEELRTEGKKEDPEVDNLDGKNVEEFLRSKTMSQPQPPGK
jgi:hypothetical protein